MASQSEWSIQRSLIFKQALIFDNRHFSFFAETSSPAKKWQLPAIPRRLLPVEIMQRIAFKNKPINGI